MMLEVVASLAIVVIVALCAASLAVGMGILQPANVPGPLMKILDEMTDRALLKKLIAERVPQGDAVHINAKELRDYLNGRVYDQEKVVDAVVAQIVNRFSKIKRNKPIGIFMISGPAGTGKTLMGKAIGEAVFGEGCFFVVQMNKLRSRESLSILFGAAPGLIGSDRKSPLVKHLTDHPRTVIILDEFEKADQEIQEAFLTEWTSGYIDDMSTGGVVDTKDVIFVLTANAKQNEVAAVATNDALDADQISIRCKEILKDVFADPVMSRIDYVFAFKPLSEEAIAALTVDMIREEAASRGFVCKGVSAQILMSYIDYHFGPKFDGRDLERHVERVFGKAFTELRLKYSDLKVMEIVYDKKTGAMDFKPVKTT